MANETLLTDFREYRRGRLPGDWTERWTPGGLSIVEGAYIDLAHRNVLQLNGAPAIPTRTALSWDPVSALTNPDDQQQLFRVRPLVAAATNFGCIPVLRGGGSPGLEQGYRIVLFDNGVWWLGKFVAGVHTILSAPSRTFYSGAIYYIRFQAIGTTIRARVWNDGDTEPSTWVPDGISIASVTDSSISSGWLGFQFPAAVLTKSEVQFLSVGTNGVDALSESSLPPSLDTWISEPDDDLEITTRLEYYNPKSATVEEVWISNLGRTTPATDYPPSTTMHPMLVEHGILASRLESDIHLSGLSLPERQPLRFNNLPTSPTSAGLFDSWPDYSFYNRPIEQRIGRRWLVKPAPGVDGILSPHRTFEIVGCSIPTQEPSTSPEEAIINLGPPDQLLQSRIPVYHNIGIPTGFQSLTSAGYLLIPTAIDYDLIHFSIYFRVFIPSAGVLGTAFATLSRRQVDSLHRQWHVLLYHASHATSPNRIHLLSYDASGNNIISHISVNQYNVGRYIDVIFSVSGSSRWYAMLDNSLVASGTLTADPVAASSQPVEVLISNYAAPSLSLFDHRIEMFADENTAQSRFAARFEPDSTNISMHRCDDNAGSTVTDYAPLANHGTLQGVNNVDRAWVPTYLGSAEISGISMPFSGGTIYNAPTQQIDSVREIFRYNDRSITSGAVLKVKSKGVLLTSPADYTEPNLGIADLTGASDQPITIDTDIDPTPPESINIHVPTLALNELISRNALSPATADRDSFSGLRQLFPFAGGFYYQDPPLTSEFLTRLLGSSGCYYTQDRDGRVAAGCMLPPINPGPYSSYDNLLEFLGIPNRGVTLPPHSSYSLTQRVTWSISCWFKLHRHPSDKSSSMGAYFPTGMTLIDRVCGAAGYYLGFDGRDGSIIFGAPGITGNVSGLHYLSFKAPILPEMWYLVQGYQDNNSRYIRLTQHNTNRSASVGELSEITTGSLSNAADCPILVGHGPRGSFYGSIEYAIGSSYGRSGDVIANMTVSRPSILSGISGEDRFFLSLNDGGNSNDTDTVYESVQSRYARLEGVRWCPRSILDLRSYSHSTTPGPRRPLPAWRTETRYRENYSVLTGTNIDAAVSVADRLSLGQSSLSVPTSDTSIRDNYKGSRDLSGDNAIHTPFLSSDAAAFVSALLKTRLGAGSYSSYVAAGFVEEGFTEDTSIGPRFMDVNNWKRDILRLVLTDEIWLYYTRFGLSYGVAARVAGLVSRLTSLDGDIITWRI